MKIFSNLNARIKAYREEHMGEDGFSLLELVVAVGVLLALSVGGFLAYSGITQNAKDAALESAASTVLSAAVAYDADGDPTTEVVDAGTEYTTSQTGDKKITAVSSGGAGAAISVTVTNADGKEITKTTGSVEP